MSKKIKLGIIGIGNMGSGHARNIVRGECPEFELVAVADIKPQRIEWAKKELPFDEELYYQELMKRVATSKRKTNVQEVFADTSKTYSGNK